MKKLTALLLLFITPAISQADTYINVSLASKHIGTKSEFEYNEINPGIELHHKQVKIGTYYNSYKKQSVYIAYNKVIKDFRYVRFSVDFGMVSGYEQIMGWEVMPAVQQNAEIKIKDYRVTIGYVPSGLVSEKSNHIISLRVGYKFN